jgi:hypothetical protein
VTHDSPIEGIPSYIVTLRDGLFHCAPIHFGGTSVKYGDGERLRWLVRVPDGRSMVGPPITRYDDADSVRASIAEWWRTAGACDD